MQLPPPPSHTPHSPYPATPTGSIYSSQHSIQHQQQSMQYHHNQQHQSHTQMSSSNTPAIDLELLEQQEKENERERERVEREKREREQREHEQRKRMRREKERERFLVELEFVQSLANPDYLAHLSRQGVFEQDSFRNYLRYLLYWKSPEYIQFIRYPQCLFFLDLLTQRDEASMHHVIQAVKANKHFIADQQLQHWKACTPLLKNSNGVTTSLFNSHSNHSERRIANATKKTKKV